jgi:hypothetical protein
MTSIPAVAQFWQRLSRASPHMKFPNSHLEIGFTIVSALFLIGIRLISLQILERLFGWPTNSSLTDEAAASMSGIVHSSLLCPGLIVAFQSHTYSPSEPMSKAPTKWWQEMVDALLQFCTGYMIYDASFIVLSRCSWDPSISWIVQFSFQGDDFLFLGHHLATTLYMTQARVYQAGHMSAMMCMLIGEASNPTMNTWFITSKALTLDCCNGSWMQLIHKYNEIFFCSLYLLLRVVVGPVVCTHMSYDLFLSTNAKEHLPLSLRLFWNMMIWAVIIGSYSWIVYTHTMLSKHIYGDTEQEL